MKRTFIVILLIFTLTTQVPITGCTKDGDPTGPLIMAAAILIMGITFSGWFQHDDPADPFPPLKYDVLTGWDSGYISGSILSSNDTDWYRTELLRSGERIKIWSESDIGVRAKLIDEEGRYYSTENTTPGSNFVLEVEATGHTTFYLQVKGHTGSHEQGPYRLYYQYYL